MRDPIRAVHGLLPDPDLHTIRPHCRHILGLILAQQGRHTRPRWSGGDNCAHYDNPDIIH